MKDKALNLHFNFLSFGCLNEKLNAYFDLYTYYNSSGKEDTLFLGNLYSKRDWGSAKDYIKTMWMMLQQKTPSDFVIATGKSHTVKKFVEESFKYVGINIIWRGKGLNEVGLDKKTKQIYVKVDTVYFRPTEYGSDHLKNAAAGEHGHKSVHSEVFSENWQRKQAHQGDRT